MEKKDIVLIGGSEGSIDVLFYILPKLPKEFSIPVVIILHREPTHESHLAELFQMKSKIRVLEVDDKMKIEKLPYEFAEYSQRNDVREYDINKRTDFFNFVKKNGSIKKLILNRNKMAVSTILKKVMKK